MAASAIGAILMVLAGLLRWEGKAPRARAVLFFGSGATLGIGLLSQLVTKVVHLLYHVTDDASARIWGTSVTLILVVATIGFLWLKVVAKGSSGHKAADLVAFLAPAILAAAGGSWAVLATQAGSGTTSLANSVLGFVTDLASGW